MNYQDFFKGALDDLREQGNYRVFAELGRRCGAFPRATSRGSEREQSGCGSRRVPYIQTRILII